MVIRMKKGQVLEGVVTRIDFPNKGIVETEEGICMVKNALPGQRVRCSVNKVRKGKAEGRLLEVVRRAPQETAPVLILASAAAVFISPFLMRSSFKSRKHR